MGAVFLSTPQEIAPSSTGGWYDVDCSSYVSASAVGVILRLADHDIDTNYNIGARKNGSSDDIHTDVANTSHIHKCVGLDASKILELYREADSCHIFIIGYFESGYVCLTNRIDKSLTTTGSYVDIDISSDTGTDTATVAFIEVIGTTAQSGYLRKNGSTDSKSSYISALQRNTVWFVGVDGSEILEGAITSTGIDFFLTGYCTDNSLVAETNETDVSLSDTAVWTDLPTLATGAIGAVYRAKNSSSSSAYAMGLRPNGVTGWDTRGIYYSNHQHFPMGSASQIVEGYIYNTSVDFFYTATFFQANAELSALIAGTSTVSGNMGMIVGLSSAIAGTSSVSGVLHEVHPISASIAGTSSVAGVLHEVHTISALIAGTSTVECNLGMIVGLSGLIEGISAWSSEMYMVYTLSALIGGTSSISSFLEFKEYIEFLIGSSIDISFVPEFVFVEQPNIPDVKGWKPIEPLSTMVWAGSDKPSAMWREKNTPTVMGWTESSKGSQFWRPILLTKSKTWERDPDAEQVSDS